MKAYVLHGIDDLRWEEAAAPVPAADEVVVQVMAAGICGSDIPRIFETGAHRHPLIPGHEFSGVVVKAGSEANDRWVGKRVGIFPLLPCRACGPCRKQQYEMCQSYSYLGSRQDGGFAEYVAVPVWNLLELPEGVSFAAAAMLEPMAVAVHAMRRTVLRPDDTVVVCGLGTIGLLLTMFLKDAGAGRLLVIGNKDWQKKLAGEIGILAEDFCDTRQEEAAAWLANKTDGNGADVMFECVGRNETIRLAIRNAAAGGRVVLVGNPASDICFPRDVYWNILRHQLQVAGTWNSSFTREEDDDWQYVLARLNTGRIHPERVISHRLPFSRLEDGLKIMREKKEEYGKVMLQYR